MCSTHGPPHFGYETAYGDPDKERTIFVYDFRGGTFDVTISHISGTILDVKAACGSSSLGGEVVDYAIQEYVIDRIKEELGSINGSDDVKKRLRIIAKTQLAWRRFAQNVSVLKKIW